MYLSDGYPQATADLPPILTVNQVYLSDGYPQATAFSVADAKRAECT